MIYCLEVGLCLHFRQWVSSRKPVYLFHSHVIFKIPIPIQLAQKITTTLRNRVREIAYPTPLNPHKINTFTNMYKLHKNLKSSPISHQNHPETLILSHFHELTQKINFI